MNLSRKICVRRDRKIWMQGAGTHQAITHNFRDYFRFAGGITSLCKTFVSGCLPIADCFSSYAEQLRVRVSRVKL